MICNFISGVQISLIETLKLIAFSWTIRWCWWLNVSVINEKINLWLKSGWVDCYLQRSLSTQVNDVNTERGNRLFLRSECHEVCLVMENCSCSDSTRCCDLCVIPYNQYQSVFLMGHGRVVSMLATAVGCAGARKFCGPRFEAVIHLMTQFAHNWHPPCCQCMETCSHVSSTQKWYT